MLRRFGTLLRIVAAVVFVAAWAVVVIGYFLKVTPVVWTVLVTVAAFATEGVIWLVALSMGLKVVEARRRIWQWIKRPFQLRKAGEDSSRPV